MAEPDLNPALETTSDERTMATLSHVLQLVGGWIAPLVIFLVKRNSRFISFHALQVLLLHVVYLFFVMIVMGAAFAIAIAGFVLRQPGTQQGPFPAVLVFIFPIVWLGMMSWWLLMLIVAIVFGIKAGRGEWAEYPLMGRLARKILKIGPQGAFLE